jgi:hypothetical protein
MNILCLAGLHAPQFQLISLAPLAVQVCRRCGAWYFDTPAVGWLPRYERGPCPYSHEPQPAEPK